MRNCHLEWQTIGFSQVERSQGYGTLYGSVSGFLSCIRFLRGVGWGSGEKANQWLSPASCDYWHACVFYIDHFIVGHRSMLTFSIVARCLSQNLGLSVEEERKFSSVLNTDSTWTLTYFHQLSDQYIIWLKVHTKLNVGVSSWKWVSTRQDHV